MKSRLTSEPFLSHRKNPDNWRRSFRNVLIKFFRLNDGILRSCASSSVAIVRTREKRNEGTKDVKWRGIEIVKAKKSQIDASSMHCTRSDWAITRCPARLKLTFWLKAQKVYYTMRCGTKAARRMNWCRCVSVCVDVSSREYGSASAKNKRR